MPLSAGSISFDGLGSVGFCPIRQGFFEDCVRNSLSSLDKIHCRPRFPRFSLRRLDKIQHRLNRPGRCNKVSSDMKLILSESRTETHYLPLRDSHCTTFNQIPRSRPYAQVGVRAAPPPFPYRAQLPERAGFIASHMTVDSRTTFWATHSRQAGFGNRMRSNERLDVGNQRR